MSSTDTLTTLFSHNLWANVRLFEVCATLSDPQLDATIVGSFGSIRSTLLHIVDAERSYLSRLATGQPLRRPKDAPTPSMAEMLALAHQSGQGLIDIAPRVQPTDQVEIIWDEQPFQVPCPIILTQAINHATEHRAQIMAILTQIGNQPPDLDGWSYFDAQMK